MTTSQTTSFNLSIDEIIDEAFNRNGVRPNSGNDMRRARRNLNILFSDWGNRGVHMWKVALNEVVLVSGQANYSTPTEVSDVLEAYVSTTGGGGDNVNTQDVSITKIDRSAYAALPNKLSTGQPSMYYVDRLTVPTIYLYQAPNTTTYTYLKYYSINRIQDVGSYNNTADVEFRFIPAMISGLAYYLSFNYDPNKIQILKQVYEDELLRALDQDGGRTSLYITPQSYFGDGV